MASAEWHAAEAVPGFSAPRQAVPPGAPQDFWGAVMRGEGCCVLCVQHASRPFACQPPPPPANSAPLLALPHSASALLACLPSPSLPRLLRPSSLACLAVVVGGGGRLLTHLLAQDGGGGLCLATPLLRHLPSLLACLVGGGWQGWARGAEGHPRVPQQGPHPATA